MLSLLRNPVFSVLWIGQWLSEMGDRIYVTALVAFLYEMTRSSFDVGKLLVLAGLSSTLFGPLAGLLVDRLSLRTMLVLSNFVSALVVALMVIVRASWQIYVIAFILAAVGRLFLIAWSATVPAVLSKEHLVNANALTATGRRVAQILGPALGGLLVATGQAWVAFAINALSFAVAGLAALLALANVPPSGPALHGRQPSLFKELREGLTYIRTEQFAIGAIMGLALIGVSIGINNAVIVAFADRALGVGPAAFGILISALGAGMLSGGLISPFLGQTALKSAVPIAAPAIMGTSLILLSAVSSLALALPLRFSMGIAMSIYTISIWASLQTLVKGELRGRVFSAVRTIEDLAILFAMGIGSLIADVLGVRIAISGSGAFALGAAIVAAVAGRHATSSRYAPVAKP